MGGFLNNPWGMYIIQVFLHSAVTATLVDLSLLAWGIIDPAVKQRFRFMALAIPPLVFPVLLFVSPGRQDTLFRLNALFDSSRWLSLEIFGRLSLLSVLIGIFALTTLIFIAQEVIPIFAHLFEDRKNASEVTDSVTSEAQPELPELADKVHQAIEPLPIQDEMVEIIQDDNLYLYSSTGLRPSIFISTELIKKLNAEELSAALAHEVAHILRNRKPSLVIAYLLRVCMFFNPLAMVIFRKMAQEEEQVCDDIAVRLVGNPEALVRAVELFRLSPGEEGREVQRGTLGNATAALEAYSHDLLLHNRITLIRNNAPGKPIQWKVPYVLTLFTSLGMNYFIV